MPASQVQPLTFEAREVARFKEPWAMAFLPDGRLLVTEKAGNLKLMAQDGSIFEIAGEPEVAYGGQGGLGDIILAPDFETTREVFLSWAEPGPGNTSGAAVGRASLTLGGTGGKLDNLEVIWRQQPKVRGRGHYGHRLAFDAKGYLFVTSGERQKFEPAQDMGQNLGKVLRLNRDGSPAEGNPFASQGGVAREIWSLGHRNPLGIAFDRHGNLWVHEMGPKGGDELNLIVGGKNYGYPEVSNGTHYDGTPIPDHDTRPEFESPKITWTPVISPSGFVIYDGDVFGGWRGNGFIGGLSSQSLVRVELEGQSAREIERWDMGQRIREVEEGPEGHLWLLEDEQGGSGGRLLKLVPATRGD